MNSALRGIETHHLSPCWTPFCPSDRKWIQPFGALKLDYSNHWGLFGPRPLDRKWIQPFGALKQSRGRCPPSPGLISDRKWIQPFGALKLIPKSTGLWYITVAMIENEFSPSGHWNGWSLLSSGASGSMPDRKWIQPFGALKRILLFGRIGVHDR